MALCCANIESVTFNMHLRFVKVGFSFTFVNAQAKNLGEIYRGIDSIRSRTDSIGHSIYENAKKSYLSRELSSGRKDSAKIVQQVADIAPFDSLFNELRDDQKSSAWKYALSRTETMKAECEFRSSCYTTELNTQLRRHLMEAQKKYTLSLSCLLFFFIGSLDRKSVV